MRIGVAPYLNARPFARGLVNQPGIELVFASPARLADLLRSGFLESALVSSSEYFNGDYLIVPEGAISSRGGGTDAMLFCRTSLAQTRVIALDAASRSTNLLLQLTMHWLLPGAPISYHTRPADSCRSLQEFDACLMIGDIALSSCHEAALRYDLAELWYGLTNLPIVLTLWLARRDADPRVAEIIRRAYRDGMAQLDEIIADASRELGWDNPFIRRYLTEVLDYSWGPEHEESLRLFGESLFGLNLVAHQRPFHYLTADTPAAGGTQGAAGAKGAQPSSQAT